LLLGFAGCAPLIGLDDFEVEVDVDPDATGGAAATGGSAGAGDAASDAPSCGDVVNPPKEIVDSCIYRSSCSPFIETSTISLCITLNTQHAFLGNACTAKATSCDDIELCQGYGFVDTECSAGQTGWRCENRTAIDCSRGYFIRCSKRGGECVLYDSNDDSVPDTAGCQVVPSCSEPAGQTQCQGDVLYECLDGAGYGVDCANLGAHCEAQTGATSCYLQTPDCPGSVQPCDGAVAQVCAGSALLRYDCGSVGLRCESDAFGPFCVAPGCTLLEAGSCAESCNGTSIGLCYGGAKFEVDCRDYGFATCAVVTDPDPLGLGAFALCTN
jgi:hypothetical protein